MKNNAWLLVLVAGVIAWSAPLRYAPAAALADSDPLLIVVSQVFATNDISLADLKTAFNGRVAQVAGKQLVPINHNVGTAQRVEFDQIVLGLDPAGVGRFWVDKRIRDDGSPPKSVPSAEIAVRVVAALPTAITYARRAQLNPKVKVLTVDGKSAGQPDYPIAKH